LVSLFLAHSELFTEGFYYPITAIAAGRGTWVELLRLWAVTLVMNLLGGTVMIALVVAGFPDLHGTLAESAHHFLDIGFSWQGAALA
ncbi:formate/nitrite transporter family protein, partial [Xanthomonas citri pv. citri]|nr:formate/nitrite transporter family protein [Xanthomonas citri pv. citri]